MRHEIVMPRLSEVAEEGVLVTWFVAPGAMVREGDLVAEVQVEKVAAEVRAPAAGRIGSLLVEPGGVVRQGEAITAIEEGAGQAPVAEAPATGSAELPAAPGAQVVTGGPAPGTGGLGGPASPAARRLARELGIDIAVVAGSGPGGRILESDVRAAAAGRLVSGGAPPAARPSAGAGAARLEPLSPMRRAIGERLRAGLASSAQLTLTGEADVTELAERLARSNETGGRRASYTEVVVRACALALRDHPRLAASWMPDGLVHPDRIDVGVAVTLEDGLIVPVVRDADHKTVDVLGREIADLAERARTGRLEAPETEGACFSVTNLGGYRIDAFTPLLNPPQTAILGVGRARPRPAVVDGSVVARTLVVLSLTFDHQVVDGAPAAAFLGAVIDLLESPDRLLA